MTLPRLIVLLVVVALGCAGHGLQPSGALTLTSEEVHRQGPPPPLAVTPTAESRIESFVLSNGMRLLVHVRGELPIADVRYVSREAGEQWAAIEQAPVPRLTAFALVGGGTVLESGERMRDLRLGGMRIETWVDDSSATLRLKTDARNVPQAISLIAQTVRRPSFAEVQPLAKQLAAEVVAGWNSAERLADRLASELLLGANDRRALRHERWLEPLRRLDTKALQAWHARYRPENSALIVVGRVDPQAARAAAERWFGSWKTTSPGQATDARGEPAPRRTTPGGAHLITNLADAASLVSLAYPTVGMHHEDRWGIELLARVMARTPTTSVWADVGRRTGELPFVRTRLAQDEVDGYLRFETIVAPARLRDGIELLEHAVERLVREPLPESELELPRQALVRSLDLQAGSNAEAADLLVQAFALGEPVDVLAQARARVASLGAGDLQQLAQRYLVRESRVLIVIGQHEARDRPLRQLRPTVHGL